MNVALSADTSPHGILLTVRDFLLLDRSGAFDAYSKAELIEGEIVCVNAQHTRHSRVKTELAFALIEALRSIQSKLRVYVEPAVILDEHNLFEPDIVLSPYLGDDILKAADVALAIEVSDTTFRHDRRRKAPRYASAGIPECWIVEINAATLHQLWHPVGDTYAEDRALPLGTFIKSVTIAGLIVAVRGD